MSDLRTSKLFKARTDAQISGKVSWFLVHFLARSSFKRGRILHETFKELRVYFLGNFQASPSSSKWSCIVCLFKIDEWVLVAWCLNTVVL